ncbi:MAG: N-acetylmuramoyl-L-alanine amidase [Candidatus Hydrogenedentes bacterium]|nr:N-acetylmuramoyl-L-alanine amidase [Candidatus Hydrogenedentota bacterium]
MSRFAMFQRGGLWLFSILVLLTGLVDASAESAAVAFRYETSDGARSAQLEPIEKDEISYVSLVSLVRQLGGGLRTIDRRIQVDFASQTAWILGNTNEITASRGRFTLGHHVILDDGDVLIAVVDVIPLFNTAFQVSVTLPAEPRAAAVAAPPVPGEEAATEVTSPTSPPTQGRVQTAVLDPGHGGRDMGAEGSGLKEKDLALSLCRRMKRALEDSLGVKVLLTREEDKDASAADRTAVANRSHGDIFISLHVGARYGNSPAGIVIYCFPAREKKRPASDSSPTGPSRSLPGYRFAGQSRRLGSAIADALKQNLSDTTCHVRELPCRVLRDTTMPSVLVEVSPLSNAEQAARLSEADFQSKFLGTLVAGIRQYIASLSTERQAP